MDTGKVPHSEETHDQANVDEKQEDLSDKGSRLGKEVNDMPLEIDNIANMIARTTSNLKSNSDDDDDDDDVNGDNIVGVSTECNNDQLLRTACKEEVDEKDEIEEDIDAEESLGNMGDMKMKMEGLNGIWCGKLRVHGNRNEMWVPCVAIPSRFADKPYLREAKSWPNELVCGPKDLKPMEKVLDNICDRRAQWYVRFVSVNEDGEAINCDLLAQVGKMMQMKKMVFAINTGSSNKSTGTLYLLGMQFMSDGVDSIAGVFCPA